MYFLDGAGYIDDGEDFLDEYEDEHQEKRKKKDKEKKGQFMKFYTNIFLDKKPKKGTLDMFFSGNSSKTVKDDVSFFCRE